jgi:hypothetical protein
LSTVARKLAIITLTPIVTETGHHERRGRDARAAHGARDVARGEPAVGPSRRDSRGRASAISATVNAGAVSAIPSTTPDRPAKLATSERVASARTASPASTSRTPASASAGHEAPRAGLEGARTQGRHRLDARGLERRKGGRERGGREAHEHALRGGRERERRAADGEHVVEVVDRARHQPHCRLPEQVAEAEAEQRSERRARERFGEDQAEELSRRRPERAQGAENPAPLDDAEEHRVVDQEGPDHEREQAQGLQVELERRGELRDGLRLLVGAHDARGRRQEAPHGLELASRVLEQQIDVAQPVSHAEEALRVSDVHQQQAVEQIAALGPHRVHDTEDAQLLLAVSGTHAQQRARLEAVPLGEGRADQHRLRVREERSEACVRRGSAAQVAAEGRLGQRVDAEDAKRLAAEVESGHDTLHDGRARPHAVLHAQLPVDVLRQARRTAAHLVAGAPDHRLGRAQEAPPRGGVREIDRHDDGHAQRYAQHHERRVQRPPDEVAQPGSQQRARHQTSRPASIVSTRSASAATSRLWVASSSVLPARRVRASSSPITAAPVASSRLPVARRPAPGAGRARARARSPRAAARRPRGGRESSRPGRRGPTRSSSPAARRDSSRPESSAGSSTFSSTLSVGIRLKNWNTKPMWSRRSSVRSRGPRRESALPAT